MLTCLSMFGGRKKQIKIRKRRISLPYCSFSAKTPRLLKTFLRIKYLSPLYLYLKQRTKLGSKTDAIAYELR